MNSSPSLIQKSLVKIRDDLQGISENNNIYEMDYIARIIRHINAIVETGGLQGSSSVAPNGNDMMTRDHFVTLQREFVQLMEDLNTWVSDTGTMMNIVLQRINEQIERLTIMLGTLEQNTNDIESKVLDKAIDRSIHGAEVKTIDFKKNYWLSTLRITDDNIITLPVIAVNSFQMANPNIFIREPTASQLPLSLTKSLIIGKNDSELPEGYWLGTLIGHESGNLMRFKIQDLYDYLGVSNSEFVVQVLSKAATDRLSIELIGNIPYTFNEVELLSNAEELEFYTDKTKVQLTNNKIFTTLNPSAIRILFNKKKKDNTTFMQYSLVPRSSNNKNDILKFNAIESALYASTSTDGDCYSAWKYLYEINSIVGPEYVGSPVTDWMKLAENKRYMEEINPYELSIFQLKIKGIDIRMATYKMDGMWISDSISTEKQIYGVELADDIILPDEKSSVMYEISFDNANWNQIRSISTAPTELNAAIPIRIELNTTSVREDYLVLKDPNARYGLWLRVFIKSSEETVTPVIRKLELRIKVIEE